MDIAAKKQVLTVEDRSTVKLNTVQYIHRFDEEEVTLSTKDARVTIEGRELKIESLNKELGEVVILGHIEGLYFSNATSEKGRGIFGR